MVKKIICGVICAVMLATPVLAAPDTVSFGDIPPGVNQDGAMAAVDAKALAEYGTDRFGTYMPVHLEAWGFGQMSSMLSYLAVPFIKMFGLNTFALRLPQMLISMGGLGAIAFIGIRIFGKRTSLIFTALAAINPWHIMQSRWALDCNLFPHFFLIAFAFLIGAQKKDWPLFVSMALFGLTMYTYGVALYIVLIAYITEKIVKLKQP